MKPDLLPHAARSSGMVLIAAGLYQLTPLKTRCLTKCRSPLAFTQPSPGTPALRGSEEAAGDAHAPTRLTSRLRAMSFSTCSTGVVSFFLIIGVKRLSPNGALTAFSKVGHLPP